MSSFATLILETSTPHASVALVEPDGTVTQREFTGDRSHNGGLFAPLEELLSAYGRGKIELVLVGSGPGSYSGTRVGIAAAQGVAIACGCPAIAVPSILAVPAAENGGACLAIGDARRGSFWTAKITSCELTQPPTLTDAEGLAEIVLNADVPVMTFEDPARFPVSEKVMQQFPDAQRLWQAWKSATPSARALWQAAPPQPIYLKPPHISQAKRPWLAVPQA